jgi:hypothetical protein
LNLSLRALESTLPTDAAYLFYLSCSAAFRLVERALAGLSVKDKTGVAMVEF